MEDYILNNIFVLKTIINYNRKCFYMPFDVLDILIFFTCVSCAISGALTAMDNKLDYVGIFIVAFITTLGGGTLRDLFLNRTVIWVLESQYVYYVMLGALLTILFRKKVSNMKLTMLFFDSIGLGLFSVYATDLTLQMGYSSIVAIGMGTMNGIFGGVLRDIICNEIPLIFRSEIYTTVGTFAAILFWISKKLEFSTDYSYLLITGIVISLRWIIVKKKLAYPSIYSEDEKKE